MLKVPISDKHLLVVAPHPDDEVLGCAGSILQALERGERVSILYLTHGDANRIGVILAQRQLLPKASDYLGYGAMRRREADDAMNILGVEPRGRLFFGLPDLGLRTLARPNFTATYRSPFTQAESVPYLSTTYPELPFTHTAIVDALHNTLTKDSVSHIIIPLPVDSHSDHRASARLIFQALTGYQKSISISAYPVHSPYWPKPRRIDHNLPLLPPSFRREEWQPIPLSALQVATKQRALSAYASQLQVPMLGKLMNSLVRSNELLLPLQQ